MTEHLDSSFSITELGGGGLLNSELRRVLYMKRGSLFVLRLCVITEFVQCNAWRFAA